MRAYNRFAGDPALKITENGAFLQFIGGQPIMDQGLNNAVLISLFTKPGWWGNTLIPDPNKKVGSEYQKIRTVIDVATVRDVSEAADEALRWMTDTGLVNNIEIQTVNPAGDQIRTAINFYPPGNDVQSFLFTKNGLSWIGQATNPAYKRFTI